MLASDQASLGIISQTVRAGFVSRKRLFARVTGGLHKDALAFALLPFDNRVFRDVGEEQVSLLPVPDRPLYPLMSVDQLLDIGACGDEFVEGRVEADDFGRGIRFGCGGIRSRFIV